MTSKVSDFDRRLTIRMTWGEMLHKTISNDFKTFFVVGKSTNQEVIKEVKQESDLYKDIIFGDFDEMFYNLPFKVETGFEWAYKHCSYDY